MREERGFAGCGNRPGQTRTTVRSPSEAARTSTARGRRSAAFRGALTRSSRSRRPPRSRTPTIGVLRGPVADAICSAADEILARRFDRTHPHRADHRPVRGEGCLAFCRDKDACRRRAAAPPRYTDIKLVVASSASDDIIARATVSLSLSSPTGVPPVLALTSHTHRLAAGTLTWDAASATRTSTAPA